MNIEDLEKAWNKFKDFAYNKGYNKELPGIYAFMSNDYSALEFRGIDDKGKILIRFHKRDIIDAEFEEMSE